MAHIQINMEPKIIYVNIWNYYEWYDEHVKQKMKIWDISTFQNYKNKPNLFSIERKK